jgi:surface polysaccharide O-acyltransferase-like enzyme
MNRNGSLNYARLVAAFGIVFFHAGASGASIGYAALPFFLILMIVLAVPSAKRLSMQEYAMNRAQRLLIPWVIWSGIYAALKLLEISMTHATFNSEFAPYMLLTGPALHLWFLPFAFVACLLTYPLMQKAHSKITLPMVLSLVLIGVTILSLCQGRSFAVPFAQWIYGLPAVCLGIALAIAGTGWNRILGISAIFTCGAFILGATNGLEQLVIALIAYIICIKVRLPDSVLSNQLGGLALGVYLSHPLVLSVLERTTALHKGDTAFALLGCLGACAIAWGQTKLGTSLKQRIKRSFPPAS